MDTSRLAAGLEHASLDVTRSRRGRAPSRRIRWMPVLAIMVSLATLLPLGFVVWAGIATGWSTAAALIFRPRVGELLISTVLLVVCTLPLCIVLATALAWLTERSDIPGARIWAWFAVAPLAIPAFVQSYAWITLFPGLHGLFAGVLISTLAYFPFLYLPLAATLRRIDPGLEEAAASLGQPPWRVFFRVVVPQLRLALCGGSLLIGLHLLAEYGLYVFIRFDTFTTAIVEQFQSTFNGPAANMLAGVLVVCCLGLLTIEVVLRGERKYARVGSGASRPAPRTRLGRRRIICVLLPAGVTLLSIGVPLLTIAQWLAAGGSAVWQADAMVPALMQTLGLAIAGGVVATLAALPMARLSIRSPGPLSRLLEGGNYIIGALPGVVVALALVTITVRVALPLYQTSVTLIFAYALMFLPRALISLRASIAQIPIGLEQAAASLGRSPARVMSSVTLRLAAPGVASGMALVGLGITNELTATQMLAPNGLRTLAMAFWSLSGEIDYAGAAPYALMMMVLSVPLTWVLYAESKRIAGR